MNHYFVSESRDGYASKGNAFAEVLSPEALRRVAPAVFAERAHERAKSRYTFISTQRVVSALHEVGFVPVYARQTVVRGEGQAFARHLV